MPRNLPFALCLLFLTVVFNRAAIADADAVFDRLFGDRVKGVARTISRADDIELGRSILDAANKSRDQTELVAVFCDQAFTLCHRFPDGYVTACDAMRLSMKAAPARRSDAREKLVDVLVKMTRVRTLNDRDQIATEAVQWMQESASEQVAEGNPADAVNTYRKALILARQFKLDAATPLAEQMDRARRRITLRSKVEQLQGKLLANSKDHVSAEQLVTLYVVELDEPRDALPYLDRVQDADLKTNVLAAAKSAANIDEATSLQLGEWYESLAGRYAKTKKDMLRRANTYLSHYLALHTTADLDRKKAELLVDRVRKSLGGDVRITTTKPTVTGPRDSTASKMIKRLPFKIDGDELDEATVTLLYEAFVGDPKSFQGVKLVTPVKTYFAAERPMAKREGTKVEMKGALAPHVHLVRTGFVGDVIWGPYQPLQKGNYLVLYRVNRTDKGSGAAVVFDIREWKKPPPLGVLGVDARDLPIGQWRVIAVPIKLEKNRLKMEYTARTKGMSIALDRIDIVELK